MPRLDPRSPLVFDTRELGRRPGSMHPEQRVVEAPEDLGTDVIAVAPGTPVDLDLRCESVLEGVLVTGTITTTATALTACPQCRSMKQPHMACPSCGSYNGRHYAAAERTELQG